MCVGSGYQTDSKPRSSAMRAVVAGSGVSSLGNIITPRCIAATLYGPPSMAATIIDGKAVAARVRAAVAQDVAAFTAEHGTPPGLATILIGDDPASAVYVTGKQKACAEV